MLPFSSLLNESLQPMMNDVIKIGGNRHGKTEEARKLLAEYRKAHPDAHIVELKHGHLSNMTRETRERQARYHDIYRYAENFDVDPSVGEYRSSKTMRCAEQCLAAYYGIKRKIVPTLVRVDDEPITETNNE